MKCERCGRELSDIDLYCDRCGQAVFPEYMDEEDVWAYYKSDTELEQLLKDEKEGKTGNQEKRPLRKKRGRDKNSEKKPGNCGLLMGKRKDLCQMRLLTV